MRLLPKLIGTGESAPGIIQNHIKEKVSDFFERFDLVLGFIGMDQITHGRKYAAQIFIKETHLKMSGRIEFLYSAYENRITLDYFYPNPGDTYYFKGYGGVILISMFSTFSECSLYIPAMSRDFQRFAEKAPVVSQGLLKLNVKDGRGLGLIPKVEAMYQDLMRPQIVKVAEDKLENFRV